jgi:hypothetical protein
MCVEVARKPEAKLPLDPSGRKGGGRFAVSFPASHELPTGTVATILITMDAGTIGLRVLLIKSFTAEYDLIPFLGTGQAQHACNCPDKSWTYTFAQITPLPGPEDS